MKPQTKHSEPSQVKNTDRLGPTILGHLVYRLGLPLPEVLAKSLAENYFHAYEEGRTARTNNVHRPRKLQLMEAEVRWEPLGSFDQET